MKDRRIILIATSEPITGQEILGRLSSQGYRAVVVERGSDALLAVAEENVSLIILDLSIQEPPGAKTVEILRKMRPRLPIIVLSGDHSVETGRQVLQQGVFYYFLKPLNHEELDQIVKIALAPSKRLKAEVEQSTPPRTGLGKEKGVVA